jgi:hypothetical protein
MAEWKSVSFEDGVDTKIATHTAIASAHHVKYTNAEAVSAVATGDDYVKNDADDETTGLLTVKGLRRVHTAEEKDTINLQYEEAGVKSIIARFGSSAEDVYRYSSNAYGLISWGHKARGSLASPSVPSTNDFIFGFGCRIWDGDSWVSAARVCGVVDGAVTASSTPSRVVIETCASGSQSLVERFAVLNDGKIDIKNNPIKDPKNHAASVLWGTKKLVEIDIGGTPYYFEVYPTKA